MNRAQTCGILLAGGLGTRLLPMTAIVGKHLQPIYNKPMIYYPLATLMGAGVRRILLITTARDRPHFEALLGDGRAWGVELSYAVQDVPRGIADALRIGARFIGGDRVMLVLGDNVLHGPLDVLRAAVAARGDGATIFACAVADPSCFGVVEFDADQRPISLEERPARPRSKWAVIGIYLYGPDAPRLAATLEPSARGELEITDLNRLYLEAGRLKVHRLGHDVAWFDTGTPDGLLDAGNFVRACEARRAGLVGSPEEAAWQRGWCTDEGLAAIVDAMPPSAYRSALEARLRDGPRPGERQATSRSV